MSDIALDRAALAIFENMVSLPADARRAFLDAQTVGQPQLRARVEALLRADASEMRTGAATDSLDEEPPPDRIGAYAITERIGRGGMGSVYRGERTTGDFAHEAAIKLIKPGLLSAALVERFQRERQLLARLRHPNIAQLYDGGETPGGSPFIIMELVDGAPLLDWLAQHDADKATRLRLFADICGAVAFANRNLVVHRDLTPSNILVTSDGIVKLIDFGIAKPVDEMIGADLRPSLDSLSLTPGYAAPERLLSSAVSTAADVYSLGKILAKVIEPGDSDHELKSIIARATNSDPSARYPSADALATDVQAWSRNLPVSAMAGSRLYPARKFLRRHWLGSAAAAGALLLLIGALVVTLLANQRAEQARREAEQRFEQTRAIAKSLLFDTYDEVSHVPGSTRARALLARVGLSYLDALAADPDAPIDVQIETANGYVRLAQVTGGGSSAQLGRFEDANALLGKAQAIAERLSAEHGDEPAIRRMRANLLVEQAGTNLYNNNETALARSQAQEAQALIEAEATAEPDFARLYAAAIQAEGDTYLWDEEFERARATHLRAEVFIASLPDEFQRNRQVAMVRSANLRLLGEAYNELNEDERARLVLDQAVAQNHALVRSWPDDPSLQRKLSVSLRYRAQVHRSNDRGDLARASIEEALAVSRGILARDVNDAGALQLVAIDEEVHAEILSDLTRFGEANAAMDRVLGIHARLVELAGNAPGAMRSMAQAVRTAGGIRYNSGDYVGACRLWRQTLDLFTRLDQRGVLTEVDRNRGLSEVTAYYRRACEGGPPRAALGRTI